jgi:hypothetical protein
MRRWLKWSVLLGLPVIAAVFILLSHPHLAITEPVGADVAVVEGWMPAERLREAAIQLEALPYRRIHTTGTIRPFTYHLHVREGVDVVLREPAVGELRIRAAGLPGARIILLGDRDTLDTWNVQETASIRTVSLVAPLRHLRFVSVNDIAPNGEAENVALIEVTVNGENLHLLQRETLRVMADGSLRQGWPTYAHAAAHTLHQAGIPEERLLAIPTWGKPDSRSWANAATFGAYAQQQGCTAVDVYTLGVHARRSRELFRRGCGPGIAVGVISINDPRCDADDWWKHWSGWFYVLKELGGSTEPYAVDLTH